MNPALRMRYRTILHISAINCLFLAVAFLLCGLYAAINREGMSSVGVFLQSAGIVCLLGGGIWGLTRGEQEPSRRDGFAIVVLGWVVICALGTLPYLLSGVIPSFNSAFFESVSGFSTTGATVLTNLESYADSILFYRSLTQLMGGMGILVMVIAILPFVKGGAFQIFQAEVAGPSKDRITPQIVSTAKVICGLFLGLWLALLILLKAGGISFLDAFTTACGSISTGGLCSRTASIGQFQSLYIEVVSAVFQILAAMSFSLHYAFLKGNFRVHLKDEECRIFLSLILLCTGAITLNLFFQADHPLGYSLRHAFFQVATIISTSGFMSVDFDQWPDFSRFLLVLMMFMGGCSGSTCGAIKFVRIILICKILARELKRSLHPQAVYKIKIGSKYVDEPTLAGVGAFFAVYLLVIGLASLLMTLFAPDMLSAVTSVITTLGGVGPGLGKVGPAMDFSVIEPAGKMILSLCMLLGRLEIFSFFVLFAPDFWKK